MMQINNKFISTKQWFILSVFLIMSEAIAAAEIAGKVVEVEGIAISINSEKTQRLLHSGDVFYSGEIIKTETSSSITLGFSDQTVFELGEGSEVKIDQYSFRQSPTGDKLITKMLKGTFRFVSGLIAKVRPQSMHVKLSTVGTIGIRGTHVAGNVTESSAKIILLEPENGNQPTAIEVTNAYGSVVVDQHGWGTEIIDQHSAPTPAKRMSLRTINNVSRAVKAIR